MELRLIGAPAEVTAAISVLRAAGWDVKTGREYPARGAHPDHIRVYPVAHPPVTAGQMAAAGLPWAQDAARAGVVQP